MYYVVCVKTLEKYIVKIPGKKIPYLKEFETLLTSSKAACSDMITCTVSVSANIAIVTKVLNFIWMTFRFTYIIIGWLPGDNGLDSR